MPSLQLSDFGLVTSHEAAAMRGVRVQTIWKWIRKDLIPAIAVELGSRKVFLLRKDDVENFVAPNPKGGGTPGNQNARRK